MIMQAAYLLGKNPTPSREEIIAHMNGNICRCGTYQRIIRAIQRTAQSIRR
jgi:isoquinoline 1-oxidoreductase alpha subunit